MAFQDDGSLDLIWGAQDIGRAMRRSPRQVHHLLEIGALPGAKKVGGRWCISRRALVAIFEGPPMPQQ